MTADQFNEQFKEHREEGSVGCTIVQTNIVDAIAMIFNEEIKKDSKFTYSEVSRDKRGIMRIHTSNPRIWERQLEEAISEQLRSAKH